jgi:5-methylcytosine-specific restriction endonuclease McrA
MPPIPELPPLEMKTCTACKETKPLGDFHRCKRSRDGHVSRCTICTGTQTRAWRAANRERRTAYQRAYYRAHADGVAVRTGRWRERNADRVKAARRARYATDRARAIEASRAWRAANPERLSAQGRAWRAANPARKRNNDRRYREANRERIRQRVRAYRRAHPEGVRERNRRRRAIRCGASEAQRIDYAAIVARDGGRCGICGRPVDRAELHFDHIVPLSLGGAHAPWNLRVTHAGCNLRKGARLGKGQLRFLV